MTFAHRLLGSLRITALLAMLCSASCGGNSITFPQGPISGAGDLGFGVVQVSTEPFASFSLAVDFDSLTQVYTFSWEAPQHACDHYRLILASSPQFPLNPITQVTQIRLVEETAGFQIVGDTELTSFVQQNPSPLSALVLCIRDNAAENTPLPRSDFESVSDLL